MSSWINKKIDENCGKFVTLIFSTSKGDLQGKLVANNSIDGAELNIY